MSRSWLKNWFTKAVRRPAGRFAPRVTELEARDVPATFFVDPNALGNPDPSTPGNVFFNYRVRAYPTTYLIDAAGKVVWQSVGYEGEGLPGLKKELEKLGLKP